VRPVLTKGDLGSFFWDEEPCRYIERDTSPSEKCQSGEADSDDHHVEAELLGEGRRHPGEHPTAPGSAQGLVAADGLLGHGSRFSLSIVSGALDTEHHSLFYEQSQEQCSHNGASITNVWQTALMTSTTGLRARVRAELVQEIKDEARRQLAESGASALSLRAIAREQGMVSSGIYRYFKSRDSLLTALIVDAYDAIGEVVEEADTACERGDFEGRWSAICHAVRHWALQHPHEYALIYGSPVPGYHAPEDTNGPASRVTQQIVAVIREAAAIGALSSPFAPGRAPVLSKAAAIEAAQVRDRGLIGVPDDAVVRSVMAWAQLFGTVSFELFGRFADIVDDLDAMFDQAVREMSVFLGFVAARDRPTPRRRSTT
jgi:AcrR family transcriptional regulator